MLDGHAGSRPGENALIDQRVVNDHIRLPERVQAMQGQKTGVARTGADEPYPTGQKLGPVVRAMIGQV